MTEAPNPAPNLQETVAAVGREMDAHRGEGKVADYIPALARVDGNRFGMAVITTSDITRGFSSAKKSRASPVEVRATPSVRVSKAADIGSVVFVLGDAVERRGSRRPQRLLVRQHEALAVDEQPVAHARGFQQVLNQLIHALEGVAVQRQ